MQWRRCFATQSQPLGMNSHRIGVSDGDPNQKLEKIKNEEAQSGETYVNECICK